MSRFAMVAALAVLALGAQAQLVGPSAYLQASDGPWSGQVFEYFHLDNFETGGLIAPGVFGSAGAVIGPLSNSDSVDADDGAVDGSGTNGRSWFYGQGFVGVTWTFSESTLGHLPTHAGIVWTDGAGTITFEAFDMNGASLGQLLGDHADGSSFGTTAEDRFYGAVSANGISKIEIKNSSGGIEIDHLQFGYRTVPEPASIAAIALGAIIFIRRRAR